MPKVTIEKPIEILKNPELFPIYPLKKCPW